MGRNLAFKEWQGTANHTVRVEHWTEWLEGADDSVKHILRVSVEFINVWGHATRINAEAWIDDRIVKTVFWDLKGWKTDQVPRLTEKVLKMLYEQMQKGTVQKCQ